MSTDSEPIILDALRPRDWRQLLRAAALLDRSEGDYVDVQAGGPINLWAGPENKPAGWPRGLPLVDGTVAPARAYIGTMTYQCGDDPPAWASDQRYPVALTISIAEVRDWRLARDRHWWHRDAEAGRVVDDEAWCRRQWSRLKQYAEMGGAGELRRHH